MRSRAWKYTYSKVKSNLTIGTHLSLVLLLLRVLMALNSIPFAATNVLKLVLEWDFSINNTASSTLFSFRLGYWLWTSQFFSNPWPADPKKATIWLATCQQVSTFQNQIRNANQNLKKVKRIDKKVGRAFMQKGKVHLFQHQTDWVVPTSDRLIRTTS